MAATPGGSLPDLGQMRTSAADRERAIDVLKAAFAEGRLDMDEYVDRVGNVHASRTYRELAVLTADLPVGPLGTLPVAAAPAVPALDASCVVTPAMTAMPAKVAGRPDDGNPNALAAIAAVLGIIAVALKGWDGLGFLAVPAGFLALGNRRGKFVAIAAIILGLVAVTHG
jgi:Domain of unknown function (DUF1707)